MEHEYENEIRAKIEQGYELANRARKKGFDPETEVEATPAGDLAARVEGLVGPKGIAERIRSRGRHNISEIIDTILQPGPSMTKSAKETQMEQALRTGLAILTEGVVAAPIEGISKVKIKSNPDGSEYLAIYFAGPIRSAGGTAQGMAVLLGDYIRGKFDLQGYRPTNDEVERYVEEIKIYDERIARLQYTPSDDDVRYIVKNLAVCVDGDPTEEREVSIHRDLARVETNRIRGGACLVIAEGIAQKSRGLIKHSAKFGLDWNWLKETGKKKSDEKKDKDAAFMEDLVGGRPVFAAASAKGGFRLRYGRSRVSGIAAKSMHPATFILLDGFLATGTQIKVERPGKGGIVTPCDTVEGPIVRLKDGSVVRVETEEQAKKIKNDVSEILFLGDILVSYGDFLQTNTALLPAGYCEEWWATDVEDKTGRKPDVRMTANEAVKFSLGNKVPLHPKYTYRWEDVSGEDLRILVEWLVAGRISADGLILTDNKDAKKILELVGVPHLVNDGSVVVEEYLPLLYQLGIFDGHLIDRKKFDLIFEEKKGGTGFDVVGACSLLTLKPKSGTYIGCRMGRPEKAKERKMQPPVHSLFPVGNAGGKERSINAAVDRETIRVEITRRECPKCRLNTIYSICPECGEPTISRRICPSCKRTGNEELCPRCRNRTLLYEFREVRIKDLWQNATEKVGHANLVKGVKGMISECKVPEPLEKGILRARNSITVFKDGTVRFDATDAPLTHFKPREVDVSVEKLGGLGYGKDYLGNELKDENQILELKVQDVIIPRSGAEYLLKTSKFIDELLTRFYGLEPFYKAGNINDLLGHLVVGLAPHTSAGIIGRIAGFTTANVCYAHPYWHAAKRRNCDGDEDAFMLLLDALVNFSRKYLPEKRGGYMDAPLVITTILNPKEIDDEAHKMEIVDHYPAEFYESAWKGVEPGSAGVNIVRNVLDTDPYSGLRFTNDTADVSGPVKESTYVKLKTMEEKVDSQLGIAKKIRAIDERKVAELLINSHFLRDTYGNLRAYSRQHFRCVKCNANYRRVPLIGKCTKCGGRILLTVSEGTIRKYLGVSTKLANEYGLSEYIKQRLMLLDREIKSVFTNQLSEQQSLSDFM